MIKPGFCARKASRNRNDETARVFVLGLIRRPLAERLANRSRATRVIKVSALSVLPFFYSAAPDYSGSYPIIRHRNRPVGQHLPFMPHVIVGVGLDALQTLLEPFVLVRRMIRNEIHDDFDRRVVRDPRELVEVVHGAERFVDGDEVGNVVAKINHRTGIDRRQPESVDIYILEVFQLARDTCACDNYSFSCSLSF